MLDWVVDTGASDHMTSFFSQLHDVQTLTTPLLVALPEGTIKKVFQVGTVSLTPQIVLHNVLYIPDFKHNLLLYLLVVLLKLLTWLPFSCPLNACFRTIRVLLTWRLLREVLVYMF
ncbi:hypothetical protein RND81_05G050700 [Saponaria officinalis]|uniref:Retrovirus-related Pol polyprotein from transposon TNT 1-94-like beta-barrel domain-containing protein n=1 Tax=Saponaria officinalis TaxID=3572 RepID=A0AAW1KUT8_SAPOF